ncbi:MAG: beta-N-acetylhexosaminidase, partial [Chitinophagaceae bacterium]
AFIKKYIDLLAAHKFNTFHWHLTDDQGWRIEIRKYPELTSIGAWRHGTITGRYPGTGNTNQRYGGYYTQEEVREVLRYAQQRYVTILPEIDVPGHSSAAIAAYPWLSCFPGEPSIIPSWPSTGSKAAQAAGQPKQVQETWGVFYDILCAGNDSTFTFLEGVLDEVMELFPGPYVHIGGDEAPKSQWKRCPRCQARMKAEGLKDEHELQSYFIRRLERHVNKAGRNIFGWDEILEGGLAPNAAVMSWQGERGGILAAKEKHEVVMTPTSPLYFDYSQTKTDDSLTRGGFNPIDSVYTYEAVPRGLDSASARYILGAQANVWAEYITNGAKVEYMVFPRAAALAEALWTPKERRSWTSFEQRLPSLFAHYDLWKVAASRAFYYLKPDLQPDTVRGGMILRVSSKLPEAEISFARTSNPSKKQVYKDSIRIDGTESLFVYLGGDKKPFIHYVPFTFRFSKSTAKRVTLKTLPNRSYPGLGAFSLVNATWSAKGLSNPDWLGFLGNDIDATIDFGKSESFTSVRMHTLDQNGSWIYLPQSVEIQVSDDGQNFRTIGQSKEFGKESPTLTQGWITVTVPPTSARYLRVFAKNYGVIPEGQPGAGTRAWLFADELVVE